MKALTGILSQLKSVFHKPFRRKYDKPKNSGNCHPKSTSNSSTLRLDNPTPENSGYGEAVPSYSSESKATSVLSDGIEDQSRVSGNGYPTRTESGVYTPASASAPANPVSSCASCIIPKYGTMPRYSKIQGPELARDLYPPIYYSLTDKKREFRIRVQLPETYITSNVIRLHINDECRELNLDGTEKYAGLKINLPESVDTKNLHARSTHRHVMIKIPKLLSTSGNRRLN